MDDDSENIHQHGKRKRVMMIMLELLKGREIAKQLQTLLIIQNHHPVVEDDHHVVLVEDLALQISTSFIHTLSLITASTQISGAVDGGGSGEGKKNSGGARDRRGCYKRRRSSSDSWTTASPTTEDGCAWRKYGQKVILNSKYPRCTHKHQGCKSTKQVQRIKEDPILYQTTYFNQHTCTSPLIRAPQVIVDSDPVEANLINFQAKQDQRSQKPMIDNISAVEHEELKEEARCEDLSEAKLSLLDPWEDIIVLEPLGYKSDWAPPTSCYQEEESSGFQLCGSSLHGLDIYRQFTLL